MASWRNADEQATKPAREKYPATMDSSSAVAGKARPPQADFSSATSLLSTKEPITNDERPAPPIPAGRVPKKDKAKRRKPKAGSHKKKARKKSKTAPGPGEKSPVLPEDSYTGGDVYSGAAGEDKPRWKNETAGAPSQDKVRSRVARHPITSTESSASNSTTASPQTAKAVRRGKSAGAVSQPTTSVRAPGEVVDTKFHEDSTWVQDGSKTAPLATGAAVVHVAGRGSHPGAKATKRDSTAALKTAPPLGLQQWTSKREERGAESKPSAQTPADVPRSGEALGTSAGASRGVGVHKRHARKHRTSKSPAGPVVETSSGAPTSAKDGEQERPSAVTPRAVSSDSAEKVFDEVVAVHHHRRRSHGRSKRRAKEVARRRHFRKTKEDRLVDTTQLATGGELPAAALADVTADVGPSRVEGSAAATARKDFVAQSTTSVASAPAARCRVMPPTADVTLTGTDTGFSVGSGRRPPKATTVVKGDDVTVHVDFSSRNRAAMFWPFGRRGDKKKN